MTLVRITMFNGGYWEISLKNTDKLGGLPSGRVYTLDRPLNELQKQTVLIRPYYRRLVGRDMHIFAVQVKPPETKE